MKRIPFYLSLLLLCAAQAGGHSLGEGYVFLEIGDDRLEGRVEMRLEDLDVALGIDHDRDGKVSLEELLVGLEDAREYTAARLALAGDGRDYDLEWQDYDLVEAPIGRFVQLHFASLPYAGPPDLLDVDYSLLFEALPRSRGLLIVEYNEHTRVRNTTEAVSLVFHANRTHQQLDLTVRPTWSRFLIFVREGIWHIWIGIDHILFLVALLLPAVLKRENGSWIPVHGLEPALWQVIKIVTLFTVAHSVTLSLAALDLVRPNMRVVESVIAASVVVAAAYGASGGRHVSWVVFAFGLFHGFGFANVLGHLAVDRTALVPVLLGFNVGVELGQVAILVVAFPLLYLLRRWAHYPRLVLQLGSAVIAALALVWLVERVLDITLIGI